LKSFLNKNSQKWEFLKVLNEKRRPGKKKLAALIRKGVCGKRAE